MSNKNQINQIEAECQKIYEIGQKVGIEQALKAVAAFRKRLENGDCSCKDKKKYEEFVEEIKEAWAQEQACDKKCNKKSCKCAAEDTPVKLCNKQRKDAGIKRQNTLNEGEGPFKWRSSGLAWKAKATDSTDISQIRLPLGNDRIVCIEGEEIKYYNVDRKLAKLMRAERTASWTWDNLRIKEGAKIISRIDGATQAKVTGNRHVLLDGVEMSLAEATKEVGKENGRYTMFNKARTYWAYKGICLNNLSTKYAYLPNRQTTNTPKPSGLDVNSKDFTWSELGIPSGSMLEFASDAEYVCTTTGRNKVIYDETVMTLRDAYYAIAHELGVKHWDYKGGWTFNGISIASLIKRARPE